VTRRRSTAPARLLSITRDPTRGLGMLRGPAADRAAWLLSPDDEPPRWSSSARGWVVSLRVADDATGWGQLVGAIVTVRDVEPSP
jgi:hypothetical protein